MRKNERHNIKRSYFSIVFPIMTIMGIGFLFVLSSFYEKSWSYNWNGIRSQIKDSIKVAEPNGLSSGLVGLVPKRNQQYFRQMWIMENATKSELLKLTDYPNATVKGIAYEGLIRKETFNNKSDLILKAITDKEFKINYQTGCTWIQMSISEYLIEFVLYINDKAPPPPIDLKNQFGLTKIEQNRILTEYRKEPNSWWR